MINDYYSRTINRTVAFNHELNVIFKNFIELKITNERMAFNATKLYRVVCYMPTVTIKYKFERNNTSPEHNTRIETVYNKEKPSPNGGSQ